MKIKNGNYFLRSKRIISYERCYFIISCIWKKDFGAIKFDGKIIREIYLDTGIRDTF
jgi:hypothetical protein